MDKKMQIAAIVVVVLAIAAVATVMMQDKEGGSDESVYGKLVGSVVAEKDFPNTDSRLWVYGNANEDDRIDRNDVEFIQKIIDGKEKSTRLADANADGVVDSRDIEYLNAIIKASENQKDEIDVYYIDSYFTISKVSWPVKNIATTYCSGLYTAAVTGIVDKIVLADETIKNYWSSVDKKVINAAGLLGSTESPNYEEMMKSKYKLDVYVPGYCDSNADLQNAKKLNPVGIDVMYMNTSDNSGVDYPNEYIDRSIVMFGFLLQGNPETTYKYLDWHDKYFTLMEDAVKNMQDKDKSALMMSRSSFSYSETGKISITGKNNTNLIHAEWAGVYALGQHGYEMLNKNYQNLTKEQILTLIDGQKQPAMYIIDNEHDGLRGQRMLTETIAANAKELSGAKTPVHYLGMAREAGNSPMYVIEMAFYQNIMYPDLYKDAKEKVDYKTLFDEFFQMFLPNIYEDKALYEKVEPGYNGLIDHFFLDYGLYKA